MTGFRIMPVQRVQFPKAKAKKSGEYLAFIRQLPCAVTGIHGVEAAHLSFANHYAGHLGRGKGTKASDMWALPLCPEEHRRQHSMNEEAYWANATTRSPHHLCLVLWGLWSQYGDEALPMAEDLIRRGIFLDRAEKFV